MQEILYLIVSSALINNLILVQFLGLCPFMGVSNKMNAAIGMAIATSFVLTLSSSSAYLINEYILLNYDLVFLRTIVYITLVACLVSLTEITIHIISPLLHRILGIYLPLITTNCAVLGVMLINTNKSHSLLESAVYGVGSSVGFVIVMILFASIRERLNDTDVPEPFKGASIALIVAGIMAIAFTGFSGF